MLPKRNKSYKVRLQCSKTTENIISVELFFDCQNRTILLLGEEIPTTIETEELTNQRQSFSLEKTWNVTDTNVTKPKTSIVRKNTTEQVILFSKQSNINSSMHCKTQFRLPKGNGDAYNNVEKR